MYSVIVKTSFKATHNLHFTDGSKEPAHEHQWLITTEISSEKLNKIGLVIDFNEVKGYLKEITAELEGKNLDEIPYFSKKNPSAENVAQYIYEKLEYKLESEVKLEYIMVVEEIGCIGKYSK